MNNDKHSDNSLEQRIGHMLHSLPDRVAPASLESRVFAEIARRAALPWWRQSFARWPLAARAAFLVLTAAVAAMMIYGIAWLLNFLPAQIEMPAFVSSLIGTARPYVESVAAWVSELPPVATTIAVAAVGACYAAIFGFGAAAYRYLWKTQ